MAETSVRGNTLPSGGVTTTTDAGQAQPFVPNTITVQALSERLMNSSENNCIRMNPVTLAAGQQTTFKLDNVGLGESLDLLITGQVDIVNSDAQNAAVIALSPHFPYDLISNILVQFNGQTVLHNLSGIEALGIMVKRNKNLLIGKTASGAAGGAFVQSTVRLPQQVAWIATSDNDVTLTAGNGLTGVSSISVDASTTGSVTFGCYISIPFTMRKNLLMGLLPMQNNSVYASVSLTVPGLTGTTAASPFYVAAGWPATAALTMTTLAAQPTYHFWSIPTPNNAALYEYLISHSYMLQSDVGNTLTAVGAEALQYKLPNNYYLLSLLLTFRDGAASGLPIDVYNFIDNPFLNYNGTARVGRMDRITRAARQAIHYEGVPTVWGQLLWDATDIDYLANGMNSTQWLNMYRANNPTFVADILTGPTVPVTFSALREQLVPAQVKIV